MLEKIVGERRTGNGKKLNFNHCRDPMNDTRRRTVSALFMLNSHYHRSCKFQSHQMRGAKQGDNLIICG